MYAIFVKQLTRCWNQKLPKQHFIWVLLYISVVYFVWNCLAAYLALAKVSFYQQCISFIGLFSQQCPHIAEKVNIRSLHVMIQQWSRWNMLCANLNGLANGKSPSLCFAGSKMSTEHAATITMFHSWYGWLAHLESSLQTSTGHNITQRFPPLKYTLSVLAGSCKFTLSLRCLANHLST